jgi:hypothetical protein
MWSTSKLSVNYSSVGVDSFGEVSGGSIGLQTKLVPVSLVSSTLLTAKEQNYVENYGFHPVGVGLGEKA